MSFRQVKPFVIAGVKVPVKRIDEAPNYYVGNDGNIYSLMAVPGDGYETL